MEKKFPPAQCSRHEDLRVGFRKRAISFSKADYVRALGVNPNIRLTRYIKKVMAPVEGCLPDEKEHQWVFEWGLGTGFISRGIRRLLL